MARLQRIPGPQAGFVIVEVRFGKSKVVRVRQKDDEGLRHHGLELGVGVLRNLSLKYLRVRSAWAAIGREVEFDLTSNG